MHPIETLTANEKEALLIICEGLSSWRDSEPGYSCIDGEDVAKKAGWSGKKISGVISSLSKKGFVQSDDDGDFKGIIFARWENIPDNFGR